MISFLYKISVLNVLCYQQSTLDFETNYFSFVNLQTHQSSLSIVALCPQVQRKERSQQWTGVMV